VESAAKWTDFLVAGAGAAGALAGLVFVALSINLKSILALPGVAGRAGETILILGSSLLGSLMVLVPDLRPSHLGSAFLLLWLPTWGIPSAIQIHGFRLRQYHRFSLALYRFILHQLATTPLLLAGLSLKDICHVA
jgi:modulator of FtsH protease